VSDGATPDGFDSRDNSSRGRDRLGTDRDVRDVPSGNLRALARTFLLVTALSIFGMAGVRADSLTALGVPPGGGTWSQPYGISADGKTVVGAFVPDGGLVGGFIWTPERGVAALPAFVPGIALATSSDGSVIVGYGAAPNGDWPDPTRWSDADGVAYLGYLLPGTTGVDSSALAVSGDGAVVVGYSASSNSWLPGQNEAFRWTAQGGMLGLGDLEGGAFSSSALGVSADGSVVVGFGTTEQGMEAIRWTEAAGMVGLGTLAGAAGSEATAVSADGSVIVGDAIYEENGFEAYRQAFRWTQQEGMVGLGFPPSSNSGGAAGVSGDGSIVLGGGDAGPYLWDAAHGWRSLHDLLEADGVDVDGSWKSLFEARAMSADGHVIAGYGFLAQSGFAGWVATIPEPEPQLLSAIAAVALAAMRGASPQAWRRRAQSRAAMIRQASGIKRPTP